MAARQAQPPKSPKAKKKRIPVPKDHHLEFRPWRTDPRLKAWPIVVPD
jgi:hypothetical protein